MSFIKSVIHLILPHESNNQKAKLLHSTSILIIALILLGYQLVLDFLPKSGLKILGYAANISVEEVVRLTNEKRAQVGLSALELNGTLSEAAKNKGSDMLAKNYWAHVAPDGTEPWKFFTDVGYRYRYAGENLARDFSNAPSAVEAWMASPTHRDNILSPKYREIGIAVVEGSLNGVDTTIIVQLFGTKTSDTPQTTTVAQKTATQAPKASEVPAPVATPVVIAQVLPTPVPTPDTIGQFISGTQEPNTKPEVLVSPFVSTRVLSLAVVALLLLLLVADMVLTSKRRIARIGGRTFAHISFLGMILAIVLILRSGQIL